MSTSTRVSTSMPERVAQRDRSRRRTRLVLGLVLVVVASLVAGTGWLMLGSSVFGVETVDVTGVARLGPDQVRDQAAIGRGTPLARLDTDSVVDRVRELPAVRDVEVVRDWPSTVVIRVTEREPAAVQARGSDWALVDRSGVVYGTVARRPRDLPRVSAPVSEGAAALRATLDVLEALPVQVRDQVREVRAASLEQVTLRLSRGRTVEWGSTERSDRKAAVLTVLLTRKARVYDVSAPNSPTTTHR
jgi:cell division protein FtsQ